MIDNSNIINRYDDLLYESKPSSLNEFLNNKYNNVHNELYNYALNKYIHSIVDDFVNSNTLYEFYTLISGINSFGNIDYSFDDLYNDVFTNKENTPVINYLLEYLSINRYVFFKAFYDIVSNKLDNIKTSLKTFDINNSTNIENTFKEITKLTEIQDFRFVYLSLLKNERGIDNNLYTLKFDNNDNMFILDNIVLTNDDIYSFIFSEDEYFILLDDNNICITYDEKGQFTLIINESENNEYDNIVKTKNIINKFINYETRNVINEYKDKLCELYKKYHKIIEIKNSEYWMPSSINILTKNPPYKKVKVDLTNYWNNSQNNEKFNINNIKISNENLIDSELIELNYVTGNAKMRSRSTDIEYNVPFKYLNENINVSDDMILSNTFLNKLNN